MAVKYVVALSPFYDTKEGVNRSAGEEFEVTEERFDEINAAGKAQLGADLVNEIVKEPLSPEGKKASRKKKAK